MYVSQTTSQLVYSTDWYDEYTPGPTTAVEAIAEAERGERADEALADAEAVPRSGWFHHLYLTIFHEAPMTDLELEKMEADSYPEDLEEVREFDPATDREWLWDDWRWDEVKIGTAEWHKRRNARTARDFFQLAMEDVSTPLD
jgi:hypothetical protein